ncbi:solute carrier family 25 member 38 [Irpex rosettiformis]|uniref:Solute carrier family 25 member 38 n=1 Tax=Irpex rosettiformis TaxID=378272 RepID=A0ACB8TQD9_9APHY|nr:solute carrier family 25 member 38 [Irpex rosettiformis]
MSNVSQQLISGALSGFASGICLQPFDLLKTRMQQGDGSAVPAKHGQRILHVTREVIRTNGFSGLWRGTTATLLRNVPGVAMYFTGLTQLRTLMATSPYFASMQASSQHTHGSTLPKLSVQGNLLAGATARVAVGFVLNPFTVLKARYESNLYNYNSLWGAFRSLARGGPSELFLGFWPSAIRDAPYAGLFVVFYEIIKQETGKLLPSNSSVQAASVHSFAAASSGAIATLITHPFDVIKTKMQVRSEKRYHGVLQTSATIWKQRGIEGFFDGATLRLSRKVLSSMIGWVVYEGILIFIKGHNVKETRLKEAEAAS